MNQAIVVDDLLKCDASEAVRLIDGAPVEEATLLLSSLVDLTSTAMQGFNADSRALMTRLTNILTRVTTVQLLDARIKVLGEACYYFKQIGRSFDGIPLGLVAKDLAERHSLTNLERLATNTLGTAYLDAASYEEACKCLEHSLALSKTLNDPALVCLAMTNAAALLTTMGLYQDAMEIADRALTFDATSARGRYTAFANALNGLFSAHRLRDDEAAFRYMRIGSELYDENPLADIVLKTQFDHCRAMYLLRRQDNETAELLIAAAKARAANANNPMVEILLDVAAALCDWASRNRVRETAARRKLIELYHQTKRSRIHHDHVLRALMDVHNRTLTGETEHLEGQVDIDPVASLRSIVSDTARTGMKYARELVEYTAGTNPGKELVEYTTNVKHAKFYRQISDREAAVKAQGDDAAATGFDPFAGVRQWLNDTVVDASPDATDIPIQPPPVSSLGAVPGRFRKHDELTAIHADMATLRTDSLKVAMRTAAYDVAENWALTAEFFDDQTGQHCFRVGRLAGLLAAELGMDQEYCLRIDHASRLHDIGKIAVNEMILLKPGPLDSSEVTAMRAHTEVGAQLLQGSSDATLKMAAVIARYHHAWWNGEGYPNTSGENIPLVARICAFADVYDALTNERPYKRAWPHRMAVEQMMCESGVHFDPRLMRPFLKVLERHIGSSAQPPSTQRHLEAMEANGLLASRRRLMDALNAS